MALVSGLLSIARGESVISPPNERAVPPVARLAPFTRKVLSLRAALSLDEKISLVYGAQDATQLGYIGYLPGVPRLGIPPRHDADALGILLVHPATALPSRLGWAATFDREAAYAAGQLAGNEGRALGADLVYAPQVDLTRLPNWVRNNTTYGEDPFLSGQLGIQEITGIQSKGLMSTLKHYTIYDGQAGAVGGATPGAPTLPTIVDDQTARELYLKNFEYSATKGYPSSVLASYQPFQIVPIQQTPAWSTDNPLTLITILRGQWDFRGFVESDYGANHSVHSLLSGLDQEFPGTGLNRFIPSYWATGLKPLVDPASTSYDPLYAIALDDAVAYVLYGYERFGLLDGASPAGPVTGYALPPRPDINDIKEADAVTTERLSEEGGGAAEKRGWRPAPEALRSKVGGGNWSDRPADHGRW